MPIEVQPVRFPDDIRRFVRTWWRVYEGDPYWPPPLWQGIRRFLDPDVNPYFRVATVQAFVAVRDGQDVGTLVATDDHHLQKTQPGLGLFGFFEFLDDPEVATALFDAGWAWLRGRGMHTARGPYNFNQNHEFGCRVGRFDSLPVVGNPHARPYYARTYEEVLGLKRSKTWLCYWLDRAEPPKSAVRIADWLRRNQHLTLRPMEKRHFERDAEIMRRIFNDAWVENFDHVFMEEEEFRFKAAQLLPAVDERLALFACIDGEPVGVGLTLPDYNQVLLRMKGRVLPFGWWYYLRASRYIDRLHGLIVGVHRDWQRLPIGVPLYLHMWEAALRMGVKGADVSMILEDNARMRSALDRLGGRTYDAYRVFERSDSTPRP